ncbi:MAG: PspC domain-containing protein [Actinobacteria bacterium]|nr:MAG: PspC domain-containing protein [Actinomycetota bacterium]
MHALAWPLVLIAIGVLLLTRDRTKATFGGLVRSRSDRVIGGVIGGIAERTGIDSNLARILFVVLTLFTGFGVGVVLYLAALILVPEASAAAVPVAPAPPAPPAPPVPSASQAAAAPAVPANQ